MFVFIGLLSLFSKGTRFIYTLLSFEIIMVGMLMYNMTVVSAVCYMLMLVVSVVSSVVGLVIMITLLSSYGVDYVKF